MDVTKKSNMPGGSVDYPMPVRPPGGGYGATAADIKRGYSRPGHPLIDTEAPNAPYPVPGQGSYPDGRHSN